MKLRGNMHKKIGEFSSLIRSILNQFNVQNNENRTNGQNTPCNEYENQILVNVIEIIDEPTANEALKIKSIEEVNSLDLQTDENKTLVDQGDNAFESL